MLDDHHRKVREELDRHGGREIDTAGDGFLATFDGPARAIPTGIAVSPTGTTVSVVGTAPSPNGDPDFVLIGYSAT